MVEGGRESVQGRGGVKREVVQGDAGREGGCAGEGMGEEGKGRDEITFRTQVHSKTGGQYLSEGLVGVRVGATRLAEK